MNASLIAVAMVALAIAPLAVPSAAAAPGAPVAAQWLNATHAGNPPHARWQAEPGRAGAARA